MVTNFRLHGGCGGKYDLPDRSIAEKLTLFSVHTFYIREMGDLMFCIIKLSETVFLDHFYISKA